MKRSRLYDIRFMQSLFPAAEAEAAAMGEKEPGAEHLILVALDFQEGSARRVFERVGADPDQYRAAVVAQHEQALRSVGVDEAGAGIDDLIPPPPDRPAVVYRSAPSAREVFPEVVKLVKRDKSQLSGAYIVLVASQMEYGTTARALETMGIDQNELAAAAQAEVDALNS
jgi:ATP-dependent Clp protease ATP-binding subunit ClpA